MRSQHGFTLIELMITVAIVAILSAIAVPQYSEYVMRSRITEATIRLSDQRLKMERYFQDNRVYNGVPPACAANTVAPTPQASAHFNFTCTVLSANTYIVTATGFGPMNGFIYTVNDANVRQTTGAPTGWTLSTSCWVLKRDGSC